MNPYSKLISTSVVALSLVIFTSCRIENLIPSELEPYFEVVTGSDSPAFMSALSSAASSSSYANITDFKEGFKAGYETGYAEAAKLSATPSSSHANTTDFKEGFKNGYSAGYAEAAKSYIAGGRPAPIQQRTALTSAPAANSNIETWEQPAVSASNSVASWGYNTASVTMEPKTSGKSNYTAPSRSSSYKPTTKKKSCSSGG